ncbi:MAG: hypothetical protein NT130_04500 [Candidatus Micrarchaeota archaeon]|nr:hypothetical protein [Candidatus Micrarchaeota archaeon]
MFSGYRVSTTHCCCSAKKMSACAEMSGLVETDENKRRFYEYSFMIVETMLRGDTRRMKCM